MLIKFIAAIILMSIFPVMANAASWTLGTQAKNSGGTITSRNMVNQTSASGSLFKSYTTHAPLSVTVAANTGYVINNVTVNGVITSAPTSPYTTTVQGMTTQSAFATFASTLLSVTASAGSGGTVSPASVGNIYYGTKLNNALVFTFRPQSGFRLNTLTGAGGASVSSALPAATNTAVTVTFPVGYTFNSPIALSGTFDSSNPVASVSAAQTVLTGSLVTLTGSYSGGSGTPPTYLWAQVSGPPVTLASNGNQASFTASILGTYIFTVTLDTGSSATTSVFVIDSLATAARNQCQYCHSGNGIGNAQLFSNWSSSRHKANQVMCANCHVGTDNGGHPGALTSGKVNESTFTYTSGGASFCLNGTCHTPGVTHRTVGMTCAACHMSGEIHNPNATFSAALNVCFGCHGAANSIHYYANSISAAQCPSCHNPSGHNPAPGAAIPREHFNGYSSYANVNYAAAYVTPATQCADCHKGGDPVAADDLAIQQYRKEWAASGHGDIKGAPWLNSASHNWKASGTAGVKVSEMGFASGSNDCQRCHTADGYVQFSNLSSIAPLATTAARYSEPLTCNACHNADFSPRSVSARTGYYNYTSAATGKLLVSAHLPDSRTSNICLGCHVGREAGDTIKAMAAATVHGNYSTSFWKNVSFLNSHYLTAGGQVFGVTGYEYPGLSYTNTVDHSQVGGGLTGPCVTCHMSNKSHTLAPSATTYSQCNTCHGGALNSTFVADKTANFNAALQALGTALTQKGFTPNMVAGVLSYPYFNTRDWGNKDTGPGNMGAAFNYNLLIHDPGAFAHNPTYAKRLVRDSIDYLTNSGTVDRSRDLTDTINSLLSNSTDRSDANAFLSHSANGSAACSVCHSGTLDPANGNNIVDTYNKSLHSTAPGGATCGSCHAPAATVAHPPALTMLTAPSDIAGKCLGCHGPHAWPSIGRCAECHNGHNPKQVHVGYPHFSTYSTAQYVAGSFTCDNCHYQTVLPKKFSVYSANYQWSKSGHGDPVSPAYVGPGPYTEANLAAYDFKFLGTPLPATAGNTTSQDCVRCHTATGYANYVTPTDPADPNTAFSNIQAWGTPGDRTREMVACPACHTPTPFDAGFSRRTVGILDDSNGYASTYTSVVKAWYNYSSAATKKIVRSKLFYNPAGVESDMTDSNICIACHAGRAVGDLLKQSTNCAALPSIACRVGNGDAAAGMTGTFWANVDFVDPHGGVAANFMFPDGLRGGYDYKTGPSISPYHTNINIGKLTSTQGPCVGCHMTSANKHSFSVLSTASNGVIAAIRTDLCATCHGSVAPTTNAGVLETKRAGYRAALAMIEAQLAGKGIYYNAAKAPYFFTTPEPVLQSSATRTVNWYYNATFQGANLMGAAFNLRLLGSGAGWVHNGNYSKRLLFDTIDYLNDGLLDSVLNVAPGVVHDYIYPRP